MVINTEKDLKSAIDLINYYTKCYDEGNPKISDTEWDALLADIAAAEKTLNIYFDDSPTKSIVYEVKNNLTKVTHDHPMLSLDKTKDWNTFLNYFGEHNAIYMLKLDGLTCSLTYEDGKLVRAETRGNGFIGEDILHNAQVIESIPKSITYQEKLVIDGEIICTYADFEPFADKYANPRNFASGSARLLDSAECAKRNLTFIAWNVIDGLEGNSIARKLLQLKDLGFIVVPFIAYPNGGQLKQAAKELGYPIDGLVARFDDIQYGNDLGATSHHCKAAYAYKFYDDVYDTKLLDVEWSYGRTGVLTPVAVFEDVDTGDSVITRASLHNLSFMNTLGIFGKGQKIEVAKMNEIIPQVVSADNHIGSIDDMSVLEPIHIPTVCPFCGEPLTQETTYESTILICKNPDCSAKLINKLVYFCGPNGLDIKGLSEATLNKLIDWGWVAHISDIFKLSKYRDEWVTKEGFGAKSVDNILTSINRYSKDVPQSSILAAIGVPLVGKKTAKLLMQKFNGMQEFFDAIDNKYDFTQIDGIGPEINNSIYNFSYAELLYILNEGFVTEQPLRPINESNNSITFVITGSVTKFKNRKELTAYIESFGGKVVSAVSSKVNYLINNDINSTSAKNKTAKELGIPIITEEEFINLWGGTFE